MQMLLKAKAVTSLAVWTGSTPGDAASTVSAKVTALISLVSQQQQPGFKPAIEPG